ncbi:MAG: Gfo/Idh/MocA family oxidoreductase [Verrucomicrobiaceae bacterium]|nr:Gfo/Idh/MocA family oxidoreductase [Verrucomicrobiaceae bacterium]
MAKRACILILTASVFLCRGEMKAQTPAADLRIGIIGLDTSHAEQFTMRLNDTANPNHIPGGRVVAAFPASSPDLEESRSRVDGFTATVRDKYGVRIVGSVAELCATVDAVLVLSLDGRPHLDQAKQVIALKKPFFLDKPVAASLKDAVAIYKLADETGVPLFSASAVRWYPGVVDVAAAEPVPAPAALSYGPARLLEHHPDLFFYGIHPTEALFTVMGSGCQSVVSTATPGVTVVTGMWAGGRTGTLHALHFLPMDSNKYKVIRFGGEQQVIEQKTQGDYTPMLREIVKFFQTKQPPVSAVQTLEIYAFMEAAEESRRQNGGPVSLREVLVKAGCPDKWLPASASRQQMNGRAAPASTPAASAAPAGTGEKKE